MIQAVKEFLRAAGVTPNDAALERIYEAAAWYRGDSTAAHRRRRVDGGEYTLLRMGYGKRAAADDANLCEVISVNGGGSEAQSGAAAWLLAANAFDTQYRRQLELTAAEGTVAAYWRLEDGDIYDDGTLRGGEIRLNYVSAENFLPIRVVNGIVREAAFVGTSVSDGRTRHSCVICTLDAGRYAYRSAVFDNDGNLLEDTTVALGDVKPFAVMRVAAVNNLADMDGYGLPKLLQAVPVLLGLDQAFTVLMGDIDTADKLVLINEQLCGFDEQGKPIPPNEAMKRRFIFLGEKLPQDGSLVHEIVPKIRVEELNKLIELLLSNLSLMFGYGTRKYSFEDGDIQTATQYIGERQDMMQELNRQRYEARQYIGDIVRGGLWFENAFHGTAWDTTVEVPVDFDDGLIIDRAAEMESMRADVLAGIGGAYVRRQYLMRKYNLDEAEAAKWAASDDTDAQAETED